MDATIDERTAVENANIPARLTYVELMRGMMQAAPDWSECESCGGLGLAPLMCCTGHECGCRGAPTDFSPCHCGRMPPSDEKIREWAAQYEGGKSEHK